MSKNNEYRKNHFLPVGYLKHFENNDGKIFVFDKKARYPYREFFMTTSSQICYEHERYLMSFPNGYENVDLEKETYGFLDRRFAETFRLLNQWDYNSNVWSKDVVFSLEEFVPVQYWRSPVSDAEFSTRLDRAKRLNEFGLTIHFEKDKLPSEDLALHKMILEEPNMRQILRPIMAMATFSKPNTTYDNLEWRVFDNYTPVPFLTSDNPTVFYRHPLEFEDFRGMVVLPIGNERTLIRVDKNLPSLRYVKIIQDLAQIHQANRYVLSSDMEFLKICVSEYRRLYSETWITKLHYLIFKEYVLDLCN
jgi:hypothetical protein